MKNLGRIGVLMGGCSSEREISLKSGHGVFVALQNAGCDVVSIDLTTTVEKDIIDQLREARVELVFLVLHGKFGEDGTVQLILEKAGIPYIGSGPQASRLAMDKAATQTVMRDNGILVPDFFVLNELERPQVIELLNSIGGYPVVVKPAGEGSSIGITLVRQEGDFNNALDQAFMYGPKVLVERYIAGREITSGILGKEALPLIEIKPRNDFFDFTAKYQKGLSDYIVPAPLGEEQSRQIKSASQKAFALIGCRDMARSDFIIDQQGRIYFLEINTIPGFTELSLLPKAARQQGISFDELCLRIADFASARSPVSRK